MVSDEEAEKIMNEIFNFDECVSRIKEVTYERVYSSVMSYPVFHFLDKIWLCYIYGMFPACVILSWVIVEEVLKEELAKRGYPKRCLRAFNFPQLIKSAEEECIIKDKKTAIILKDLRNKYAHSSVEEIYARVKPRNPTEGWIQVIKHGYEEKQDALDAIKKAHKILLEIYPARPENE